MKSQPRPSFPSSALVPVLALAAMLVAASATAAPPLRTWSLPGNGLWSTAVNWTPTGAPIAGDSVIVPIALGSHVITLDATSATLAGLTFQSPAGTLDLAGHALGGSAPFENSGILLASSSSSMLNMPLHSLAGSQTRIADGATLISLLPWQNDGHALVHSSAGSATSQWQLNGYVTLSGTGDLQLADSANAVIASPSGFSLTHNAGHTIHGAGALTLLTANHGVIAADAAGQPLTINAGVTNDGTMQATSGGLLVLRDHTLANAGGIVSANGGDLRLVNEVINGGQVGATGASVVSAWSGSSALASVTTSGTIQVEPGAVLNVSGPTPNAGTLRVRPLGGTGTSTLRLNGYATFSGGGAVELTNASGSIIDSPAGYTLTQNLGHSIHGAGQVTLGVTNHGLVSADLAGQSLTVTGVVTNDATMQATGGGTLALSGSTIANAGGTIAANGGDVQLVNEIVNGGTLTRTGSSVLDVTGMSYVANVTNAAPLRIAGGATLALAGSIANTGNVVVHTPATVGSSTMRLTGYATFSGSGAIQLTDASNALIESPAGYSITNATGHTIHGAGQTTLSVVNHGLVSADVVGQPLTMSNSVTNDATLTAAGGELHFLNATVANAGGTIAAASSNVRFTNGTFGGGTITSGAGRTVTFEGLPATWGTSFVTRADVRVSGGSQLSLYSPVVTDSGTITLRSPGDTATALMRVGAYTHFAGPGSLVLTHGSQSIIDSPAGYTLTNDAGHTIRGTGIVNAYLSNQGLVSADRPDSTLLLIGASSVLTGTQAAINGGTLAFQYAPPALSTTFNVLTGGTWHAYAHSTIRFPVADIRRTLAHIILEGPGSDLVGADSSLSALRYFTTVDTSSSFIVRNGRAWSSPYTVTNAGVVGVGPDASITLTSTGPLAYTQDTSGTFLVELSGHAPAGNGKLIVAGTVNVAGHLRVRTLNGFTPFMSDTFEVMTFGARAGTFAHLDSMQVSAAVELVPVWQAHRLLLVPHHVTTGVTPTPEAPGAAALAFAVRGGGAAPARLELALPHAAIVDVSVFDVSGRRVATLVRDALAAGTWSWTWDAAREHAASGVYFARARVASGGTAHDLVRRVVVWH